MCERPMAEPIRWSEDGLVCYFDGLAWGLSGGKTFCLGKTEEVVKNHPLPGQHRKPLELKLSHHNRFRRGEISKSDRGR